MKKFILIAVLCLSLSACVTTSRETFVLDHTRTSGEVTLGYHLRPGEKENVNWKKAREIVKTHCQHVLAYSDAERFGQPEKVCIEKTSDDACLKYQVEVPYQCLAAGLDLQKRRRK